jgi:hypothetical protein
MKSFALFIFLLLTSYHSIFAQSAFSNVTSISTNGLIFTCENNLEYSIVYNQNNPSLNWNPGNESPAPQKCREMNPTIRINYAVIKPIIYTVFDQNRRIQLNNEGSFLIKLFIKPATGEIGDLYFHISKNSSITPQEIYLLEQGLKGKLMPQNPDCAPKSYIVYPLRVRWFEE